MEEENQGKAGYLSFILKTAVKMQVNRCAGMHNLYDFFHTSIIKNNEKKCINSQELRTDKYIQYEYIYNCVYWINNKHTNVKVLARTLTDKVA